MNKKLESSYVDIVIPKDIANMQLPDSSLLTYYKNLENRILWLDTEVDECWLEYIKIILKFNADDDGVPVEDRKPIKLMFFSYGGSLDVNNALIDVIKASKTPVIGVNMGQACSAGCFIYLSCHKRYAMPNSTFLIHQGEGSFSGTYMQVVSQIEEYQRKIEGLSEFLLKHTNIPEDILSENIWQEWFLSADEALEYGMCDAIVDDVSMLL